MRHMPTITPSYCNPFFTRCKHFFQQIQKNFPRKHKKSEDFSDKLPKYVKQGACDSSGGMPAKHKPQPDACPVGKTKVSPADPEGQIQPSETGAAYEQQIRRTAADPAQGTEKIIQKPQQNA